MKSHNAWLFGREVRVSRTLTGSIGQVWDYLTRSELLERWLAEGEIGPAGTRVTMVQRSDSAPWKRSGYMCGVVLERDEPHHLSYTIKDIVDGLPEEEVEDSFVEFTLQESGSSVMISINHSQLGREELPWVYAEWNARLDLLQEIMASPLDRGARHLMTTPISHCMIN